MTRPLIIAHRGSSVFAPENTLAAFRRAIADGAEGVEFDVQLSKDGVPVVIHDDTLERSADLKRAVSSLTASELNTIDVGSWFNLANPALADPTFANETVPTLANALKEMAEFHGRLYVELKAGETDAERLADAVCDIIRDSPLLPQIIVKSFRLRAIPRVRFLCPDVKTAALFETGILSILRSPMHIPLIAREFGADSISVEVPLVDEELIGAARVAGLPVAIWTTDDPEWVKRGIELGLDAIITNDPAKLLAARLALDG